VSITIVAQRLAHCRDLSRLLGECGPFTNASVSPQLVAIDPFMSIPMGNASGQVSLFCLNTTILHLYNM
jgi:hypothetical protein